MRTLAALAVAACAALPLSAQTVDTLGGTTTTVSLAAARAKANVFRVDTSVLLLNFEVWLDVPGPETLTFFLYRYHSKDGTYTLDWTKPVPVNGTGVGPAWYAAGPLTLPLLAGNHYQLGVSWPGSVTYYYKTATTGQPVSFGAWIRATTPSYLLPPTYTISGSDVAQYYQRLTSIPFPAVTPVGTPCATPRLVAAKTAAVGGSLALDLVGATTSANAPAVVLFAPGAALTTPIPIFGCSLWLNPVPGPILDVNLTLSGTGLASLALPIPADPALAGFVISAQAGVAGTAIELSNAVQMTVQ